MRFTVILTPDEEDGGYVVECPSLPGCVSEGETVEEALANVKEAIEGCLESLASRHEPLPHEGAVIVASVDVDLPAEVRT
jgi:predicted RNase H-like HicB family nuclease